MYNIFQNSLVTLEIQHAMHEYTYTYKSTNRFVKTRKTKKAAISPIVIGPGQDALSHTHKTSSNQILEG